MSNKSNKVDLSNEYEGLATHTALKCKIAYNKYGGYCVPLSSHHRPAAQKILSNEVYEPQTIEYIINNCKQGDIVHAGTYFGDFLPALSKSISTNAKVWAFEPNPENYCCAKITLEINHIRNIVLTNAGLGDQQQTLAFQTKDAKGRALGGASKIVSEKTDGLNDTEHVQITTVDDTVGMERNVSIIQLDVEGYEKQALIGSLKTIQRCLPIIILEVLPDCTLLESDWFLNNILSLGYNKIDDMHSNSVFACKPKSSEV